MLSVVDTSSNSDMQSVIFCGDLLNFHLGSQLDLEDKKVNFELEKESEYYFSTLQGLRGFPNHQILLSSSDSNLNKKTIKLSKSIINENIMNSEIEELHLMGEYRKWQPILNTSSVKMKRVVELLGLENKYPPHIIRTLWSLRNQLDIS